MNPKEKVVKMDRERLVRLVKNTEECGAIGDMRFAQSLLKHYDSRGCITVSQIHWAEKIEKRSTPEEAQKARDWYERIATDEKHRREARAVATYYVNLREYWTGLAKDTLAFLNGDTEERPLYSKFMKMFNNKYAENVRNSVNFGRLWNVGDMVMLRANINPNHARTMSGGGLYYAIQNKLSDKPLVIVEVECEPIRHALAYQTGRGGCLRYKLLPLGSTETIIVNERDMKKVPKKKLK
jgi:hypothetical protein